MANKHYKTPQGLTYKVTRVLHQGKHFYSLEEIADRRITGYPSGYARIVEICESKQKAYELLLRYLEKAYCDFTKKLIKGNKKLSKFEKLLRDMSYDAFQAHANKIELSDKVLLKGIGEM